MHRLFMQIFKLIIICIQIILYIINYIHCKFENTNKMTSTYDVCRGTVHCCADGTSSINNTSDSLCEHLLFVVLLYCETIHTH